MAARCALSGLQIPIYQTVTLFRRPAQAQRRRAICTRLRSRRCAGWRLTPYPAYGTLYIKRLLCFVGPRKRSAAGQAASGAVPGVVPDGGYALSGLRKAAEPELSKRYSTPQARASAAPPGKLHPAPFPALCRMAATPYPAYGRLLNLSYQSIIQHRRPAKAQRRRASCIRRHSRRCAGWRLRLIRLAFPIFNANIAPAGMFPLHLLRPLIRTTILSVIASSWLNR